MPTTHLYIIRHAVAEDVSEAGDDASRRLTKKGRKAFVRLVRRLGDAGMEVDLIATSPLVRTRETAAALAEEIGGNPPVEVVEALAPGSDWRGVAEWTAGQDAERVAWVGHAPCVGHLVARAIGDGAAAIRMEKGAVASIRLNGPIGLGGELEWLATPDMAD
jgi:phosphohistidine phosphatase